MTWMSWSFIMACLISQSAGIRQHQPQVFELVRRPAPEVPASPPCGEGRPVVGTDGPIRH